MGGGNLRLLKSTTKMRSSGEERSTSTAPHHSLQRFHSQKTMRSASQHLTSLEARIGEAFRRVIEGIEPRPRLTDSDITEFAGQASELKEALEFFDRQGAELMTLKTQKNEQETVLQYLLD